MRVLYMHCRKPLLAGHPAGEMLPGCRGESGGAHRCESWQSTQSVFPCLWRIDRHGLLYDNLRKLATCP